MGKICGKSVCVCVFLPFLIVELNVKLCLSSLVNDLSSFLESWKIFKV